MAESMLDVFCRAHYAHQRSRKGGQWESRAHQASRFLRPGLIYIVETYERVDRALLLGEVRRVMPEREEQVMSIAGREWRAEGKAEGRVEALLRILERRFGPVPEGIRGRISCGMAEQVDTWLDRAVEFATLDGVLSGRH